MGVEVGEGVTSDGQQYATSMSYNPHAFDPDSKCLTPSMSSSHVNFDTEFAGSGTIRKNEARILGCSVAAMKLMKL